MMKRLIALAVGLGAMVAVLHTMPGCSWFRATCDTVTPQLAPADDYLEDAARALDEAAAVAVSLPGERASQVLALIRQGRAALKVAEAAVADLRSACSDSPDWGAIFRDFASIWTAIRPIVSALGSGAGALSPTVHDPVAWQLGGGR